MTVLKLRASVLTLIVILLGSAEALGRCAAVADPGLRKYDPENQAILRLTDAIARHIPPDASVSISPLGERRDTFQMDQYASNAGKLVKQRYLLKTFQSELDAKIFQLGQDLLQTYVFRERFNSPLAIKNLDVAFGTVIQIPTQDLKYPDEMSLEEASPMDLANLWFRDTRIALEELFYPARRILLNGELVEVEVITKKDELQSLDGFVPDLQEVLQVKVTGNLGLPMDPSSQTASSHQTATFVLSYDHVWFGPDRKPVILSFD